MRALIRVTSIVAVSIFVVPGSQVTKALQDDKQAEGEIRHNSLPRINRFTFAEAPVKCLVSVHKTCRRGTETRRKNHN